MSMTNNPSVPFSSNALRLNADDPLAIAKREIPMGTVLLADEVGLPFQQLKILENIPAAHKLALIGISEGEEIKRYGARIGVASQDILPGEWIHTHNLSVGSLKRSFEIKVVQNALYPAHPENERYFMGFPRPNGQFGTRNYIAVLSTVSCSAQTAQGIARAFKPEDLAAYPNVDGVIAITHTSGCCVPIAGSAYEYLQRTLLNLAQHPNIAGVVLVSLGCEVNQLEGLYDSLKNTRATVGLPILGPYLVIQKEGGIAKTIQAGIQAIHTILPKANEVQRVPAPLSALTVALQCGGSDGWSGVTANPLVGKISDRIVSGGGTVVLSETPEIYGAEQLLTNRSISEGVGQKLIDRIQWWQAQSDLLGFSLDNNPTPGNKAGGLTTIYEKSLGAVAKGGSTPLVDVYEYAKKIQSKGLVFMDTPGYDPASITGQVAGGCNLVLFTTGRGSVFGGNLAPCIKIATNTQTYDRMVDDMDFNAGQILEGMPVQTVSDNLLERVIQTASGARTKSENFSLRDSEFILWQPGPML